MKNKGSESNVEGEGDSCFACGGALNGMGNCTVCGRKQNNDDAPNKQAVISEFSELSGIGVSKAELLYDSGYKSLDDLRAASIEKLAAIDGIGSKLAKNIHSDVKRLLKKTKKPPARKDESLSKWLKGSDDSLAVWLGAGARKDERKPAMKGPERGGKKGDTYTSALRRWLSGEEDTLKVWLTEVEDTQVSDSTKEHIMRDKEISDALRNKDEEIEKLKVELEELRKVLNLDLKHLKKEEFDPVSLVNDHAKLKADLQSETSKRRRLEEEIKQVKKGSIAVIKYMKAQQMKAKGGLKPGYDSAVVRKLETDLKTSEELLARLKAKLEEKLEKAPPEQRTLKELEIKLAERDATLKAKEEELSSLEESLKSGESGGVSIGGSAELYSKLQVELAEKEKVFMKKEDELKSKIIDLEKELQKTKIERKQEQEALELRKKSSPQIGEELERKVKELQVKEKSIVLREEEIQRLKEELRFKEDEIKKIKEPLTYKEDELLRREEDLLYREKKMMSEKRKMDEAKSAMGTMEETELKRRLEDLKMEINRKEEEVRSKEKYLKSKMEELRLREQGLIEEEIEQRDEERKLELSQEKVKTGTSRLDDLLLGGLPFGSNVAIYGPPFVGKEVLINGFMAEGVKKGIPVIWVLTDKMPSDIREEMQFIVPSYEEYEKMGLVKYVDSYSKSMGMDDLEEDPNTTYIEDPTDHEAILKAVDKLANESKKKHQYYRVAFRSVSTLVAYLDQTTTYRLLQALSGRRKRDKAVTMYSIEKGMHSDQEIQMIGSVMDGMIEFKIEQLNTLFSVKGVCDVQSRAWIRYTHSKQGISVGSFSLEAIR